MLTVLNRYCKLQSRHPSLPLAVSHLRSLCPAPAHSSAEFGGNHLSMLLSTRTTIRGGKIGKRFGTRRKLVAPLSVSRRRLGSLLQDACWVLVEKRTKTTNN